MHPLKDVEKSLSITPEIMENLAKFVIVHVCGEKSTTLVDVRALK